MKLVLILVLGLFGVAQAGVGQLTSYQEDEVLHMFRKFCPGGSESSGPWAGARIFCKFAPAQNVEIVNHEVILPAPNVPDSVVFVQPPQVVYKHNVVVSGSAGNAQHTKIYVLPQKSTHTISTKYHPKETATSKPTVFFLKTNGEEGYRYGTPAPPGIAGYGYP